MFDELGHQAVKKAVRFKLRIIFLLGLAEVTAFRGYSSFTHRENCSKTLKKLFIGRTREKLTRERAARGFRPSRWTLLNAKPTHGGGI